MKNIVQFTISQEDGLYVAEGVNVPIATDGKTFEELKHNIQEAVTLYFEDEDLAALGFGSSPAVMTNFEVPLTLHGHKA